MFTTVWHYRVAPDLEAEFQSFYGPDGPWAELFRRAPGFVETVLLRDITRGGEYVTLDRWRSADDYAHFQLTWRDDYARLDTAAEPLTVAELHLGTLTS